MKLLENLRNSIRGTSVFNPEAQTAPACILWPDRDRQWEAAVPVLLTELPELLVLGDYSPEKRTGPAIWLRCVIAGQVPDVCVPEGKTLILYLPGFGRQDLRATDNCPEELKPLAELQYRGVIWSQANAKDWTILAWLKSEQGGLGLDVAQDNEARGAMQLALCRLLVEDISLLKGKRLDKDYFNTLLTGGDPIRDVLQWLDQGDAFKTLRGENEWKAFVEVCKSQLAVDPHKDGILAGAARLASHEGPWRVVWERYCEAPKRYPSIPSQLRKCPTPEFDLFSERAAQEGWPQFNDAQERDLFQDLDSIDKYPAHEARKRIIDLEKRHAVRRDSVWADLGQAELAIALGHLAVAADVTSSGLAAGSAADLAHGYSVKGWLADDAVVRALSVADDPKNLAVVSKAIRAMYLPWIEESARYLQKMWDGEYKPQTTNMRADCVLFVDGLRYDCAKRLASHLKSGGLKVEENSWFVPLPSVTGTGKPAVATIKPKSNRIAETPKGYNYEPLSPYQLKKAIEDNGYVVVEGGALAAPPNSGNGKIWVEFGDIDHRGHERGAKLAMDLDQLVADVGRQVQTLVGVGWKKVRVVTDHGWLLMPGGLPKSELAADLVEDKWGRCATLKAGAISGERTFPWFWNPDVHFALADGVSCFRKGEEYTHGGLSLQECLTLQLAVTEGAGGTVATIGDISTTWKGLRCFVDAGTVATGWSADIRLAAGDPKSSVVTAVKQISSEGIVSLIVEDDGLEGQKGWIVLIDGNGSMVTQVAIVIGGSHD